MDRNAGRGKSSQVFLEHSAHPVHPQRQQRLQDELNGKKRKAENAGPRMTDDEIADLKRRRMRDAEISDSINQHNVSLNCVLTAVELLTSSLADRPTRENTG